MYKAVIIDDEPIVLEGLCRMVPWEELGITVAGTARDGRQGKLLIEKIHPQLVITDIRMPEMDGMELIRQVAVEAPETLLIIFSGYSEFQYAKEAISYGVIGYLEKPVDIEELKTAVRRAGKILDERAEGQKRQQQEQQKARKEALYRLMAEPGEEHELPEVLAAYRDLPFGLAICEFTGKTDSDRALRVLEEALQEQQGSSFWEIVRSGRRYLFFWQTRQVEKKAEKLRQRLAGDGYGFRLAAVKETAVLQKCGGLYRKAESALEFLGFYQMRGLGFFEELGKKERKDLSGYREALQRAIRERSREQVEEAAEQAFAQMEAEQLWPEQFRQECVEMLYTCVEFMAGAKKVQIRDEFLKKELPYEKLESCGNAAEAESYIRKLLANMMEVYQEQEARELHYKIEKAAAYIRKHYREDISLAQIAEITGMNPTYFSALFKKSMGISYSQYLVQVRMEKAKELLEAGEKIMDVCEKVGYYNSRHFSECFKKYVKMTPKEYRNAVHRNPKNTDEI
ncbi:MAG: response regulator [Eubacteriales bacterium]|nr:response regulator [Eubacteriales bacterium]